MSGGASLVCFGNTFFSLCSHCMGIFFYCLFKVFSFYKLYEAKCLAVWGQMHIRKRDIPALCVYVIALFCTYSKCFLFRPRSQWEGSI